MSEREFELYLSLLSRFLRLKPAQRDEIADELRDHLEQRLEELSARGVPRDEAIRSALEEFGDAAALANHFTHVSHIFKRRLVMRRTLGSIAVLVVLLLIATAFWPAAVAPMPAPAFIIAQQPAATRFVPMGGSAIAPPAQDADSAAVEVKLAKRVDKLNFVETSLQDALDFLSDATEIDILVDRQALAEEGVSMDAPVQLVVKRTRLTALTALDLLLEPYHLRGCQKTSADKKDLRDTMKRCP